MSKSTIKKLFLKLLLRLKYLCEIESDSQTDRIWIYTYALLCHGSALPVFKFKFELVGDIRPQEHLSAFMLVQLVRTRRQKRKWATFWLKVEERLLLVLEDI